MSSKIKTDPEPSIYFLAPSDSGLIPSGNFFATFNPSGVPVGSGHVSAIYNLGPGPRTTLFEWRSVAQKGTGTSSVGSSVEQYFAFSDNGTLVDGMVPLTDSSLSSADQHRNLTYFGGLTDDGNNTLVSSGLVSIFSQYVSIAWWNSTGNVIGPSGNMVILTPVPDELQ